MWGGTGAVWGSGGAIWGSPGAVRGGSGPLRAIARALRGRREAAAGGERRRGRGGTRDPRGALGVCGRGWGRLCGVCEGEAGVCWQGRPGEGLRERALGRLHGFPRQFVQCGGCNAVCPVTKGRTGALLCARRGQSKCEILAGCGTFQLPEKFACKMSPCGVGELGWWWSSVCCPV